MGARIGFGVGTGVAGRKEERGVGGRSASSHPTTRVLPPFSASPFYLTPVCPERMEAGNLPQASNTLLRG
jgi:hypothetical protein